jgi:hypothetical protein
VAYLAAEGLHASGVLSTVACGLYLGHKSSLFLSRGARLTGRAVWDTLTFVLNGFVFILIGFQLPYILADIRGYSFRQLFWLGLLFSGVVILLRFIWVYPGARVSYFLRRRIGHQNEPYPSARAIFVLGWTGMRGVVALAAAISLPEMLESGAEFPQRNVMIFLTFCVIFVTLVLQGLTLPPLIRTLGLSALETTNPEESAARRAMIEAALAYLEHAREDCAPADMGVFDDMIRSQRRRLNMLDQNEQVEAGYRPVDYRRWREVSRQVRSLQRAAILNLRNEHRIGDELMRKLEYEIDLVEAGYSAAEHD